MPSSKCSRGQKRSTASIRERWGEWWTWMRRRGGEEEGDDASSMRSSKSGGSRGKVGRPRKAPNLPAQSVGQPVAAKPVLATQVDAWVAAQAEAMPEWQKRALAAEGKFSTREGRSRRQGSGRRRRSGGQWRRSSGQRRRSGTGTISGRMPANPSRRRARRGSSR